MMDFRESQVHSSAVDHDQTLVSLCCKLPRYVPYKGTYVPYDGTYGFA